MSVRACSGCGWSACPSDPSGQPTYCGATLWGLTVATNEMTTVPVVGEIVDLYGVTGPNGTFSGSGFVHVGWCSLEWGDCGPQSSMPRPRPIATASVRFPAPSLVMIRDT